MHARQTEATAKVIEMLREMDPREIITVASACPQIIAEQAAIASTQYAVGQSITYIKPKSGGKVIEANVVKHHELGMVTVHSIAEGFQNMSALYLRAVPASV
jgi:hypothetical protein